MNWEEYFLKRTDALKYADAASQVEHAFKVGTQEARKAMICGTCKYEYKRNWGTVCDHHTSKRFVKFAIGDNNQDFGCIHHEEKKK